MKKIIILCFILSLALTTGCGCERNNQKEKGKKNPTTEEKEVNKKNESQDRSGNLPNKEVKGVTFTNTSISFVDNVSTLVSTVKNTNKEEITLDVFDIVIKDKEGHELIILPGFVSEKLTAGEEKTLTAVANMDLSKAYDIEYKF